MHAQLLGWFNKNFIHERMIDEKYGKIINRELKHRTRGDYDSFVEFEKDIVLEMFDEMKEFVSAIKVFVKAE